MVPPVSSDKEALDFLALRREPKSMSLAAVAAQTMASQARRASQASNVAPSPEAVRRLRSFYDEYNAELVDLMEAPPILSPSPTSNGGSPDRLTGGAPNGERPNWLTD